VLKAIARQRLHADRDTLDFGDGRPAGATLPILSTRSQLLWETLAWPMPAWGSMLRADHQPRSIRRAGNRYQKSVGRL
jgi:hypothetical protein